MTEHFSPPGDSHADWLASAGPGDLADIPVPGDSEPMVKSSIRLSADLLEWAKTEAARREIAAG